MALIVQKYGGSSVGDVERIRNVAKRVARWFHEGNQVVVVVSAMRGVTDSLLSMAKQISDIPDEREMDMLLATGEQTTIALTAMALHSMNIPAISMTGAQAGIITDEVHTKAKIQNITPQLIHQRLGEGKVVIVAGFQGQTLHGQLTTLGRGGSDLTAIALASALRADICQIYTDVDGVYTTDPRICPAAAKLQEISYDEMLELASSGAKVMQSRSVEFAKKFGVLFEVRSSLNDNPGTIVKEETQSMEDVVIRGVSLDKNQAKVTLVGVQDKPGYAARAFRALSDGNINVDMIVQNVSHGSNPPTTDISFTVDKPDIPKALKLLQTIREALGVREILSDEGIGKISIVGVGMKSHSGVASSLFETLATENINIQMISTSEIRISVVVDQKDAEKGVRAIHKVFLE
ncbi:MAG: aspartate kinase [Verrucomicrobia bacterium]|nr:aspartate kinase [Verrucomicrobiota bacterium]